jgi:hypothetical protein
MTHKGVTIIGTEGIGLLLPEPIYHAHHSDQAERELQRHSKGEIQTNEHHQGTTKKLEMNTTFFTRVPMDIEHERDDCGLDLFSTNEATNKSTWG